MAYVASEISKLIENNFIGKKLPAEAKEKIKWGNLCNIGADKTGNILLVYKDDRTSFDAFSSALYFVLLMTISEEMIYNFSGILRAGYKVKQQELSSNNKTNTAPTMEDLVDIYDRSHFEFKKFMRYYV